jgi:hypothetical protein
MQKEWMIFNWKLKSIEHWNHFNRKYTNCPCHDFSACRMELQQTVIQLCKYLWSIYLMYKIILSSLPVMKVSKILSRSVQPDKACAFWKQSIKVKCGKDSTKYLESSEEGQSYPVRQARKCFMRRERVRR